MKKQSNSQVLSEAHAKFASGLLRYVHLKIRDFTLGDDLVQTTFMKTWQYLQKTGKIELMRAFLYHVLNGLIIDEYRKNKPLSLEILAEDELELSVFNSERLFNLIDGKALTELIKKLPIKYQGAITMRYIKELTLKEMAAITHESQNTMSVQVHRGLLKLRALQVLQ